jgi:hypothetical protein
MFGLFNKNNGDDGPLTNLKTISQWMQSLPAGDIYSAQEKVVQTLIQFNHSDAGFNKDRLQVLMHLDEESRDMQASLCLQYLRNARMSKAIESRLWSAIHAFYWEVTRSYHGFLMDFVANPGGSKIQSMVPLITTRAIRGFADIIKWRYFRYEKMDDKLWLRLHNLYRISEFDNFATMPVSVYRADSRPHSPAEEYGRIILLSPFGNGNMAPREIETISQWLEHWSDDINIESQYDTDRHTFYVDTSIGAGVKRCRNQITEPPLRFLSTQAILARIERIREALKRGASPVSLGLSEDFRLPEGYTLLKQAESEWSPLDQRDRRESDRTEQQGEWKVVCGLATICGELAKTKQHIQSNQSVMSPEEILDIKLYGFITERTKQQSSDRSRETELRSKSEHWQQYDGSENGLGFALDAQQSEWVKVGKLVAVAPVETGTWELGVISRINRDQDGRRLVGVRLFNFTAFPVTLKSEQHDQQMGYVVDEPDLFTTDQQSRALLVNAGNEGEQLLIDGARYARERKCLLRAPMAESRIIQLESVEETGESWLRVSFSEKS